MSTIGKRVRHNKNGKEVYSWGFTYKDNFGKYQKKSGFKTRAEAEEALAKIQTELENGYTNKDKNITFKQAAEQYGELHSKLNCKASTYDSYKAIVNRHLIPLLKNTKLREISSTTIDIFKKKKLEEGLSKKTINNCLLLLSAIIQYEIDNGLCMKKPKIKKFKIRKVEMRALTTDEVKAILEVAKSDYPNFYPILATACYTGMRKGELLALKWGDISWVTNKIRVNKSLYRGKITTPKTEHSIRNIDMSHKLAQILKDWKAVSPKGNDNFVFTNSEGNHQDPDNIVKRQFIPICNKAGIGKCRFHDLRHTYVSTLIAANVPIKYIQAQVGHSSINVTLDTYGHLLPEACQYGIDALDNMF